MLKKLQGAEPAKKPTYPKPKQDIKQEPVSKPGPKTFKEKAKLAATKAPTISVKSEASLRQPVNVKSEPEKVTKQNIIKLSRKRKQDLRLDPDILNAAFASASGPGVVPVGL